MQETSPGVLAHPHPHKVSPVVLTDFGTSILPWDPRTVHGLCGTLDYHPPELALTDMKFAAELFDSADDGRGGGLPSPDSVCSHALLGAASMDASALQRAASALFDEKMDVWGLGMLMYECLAEHLPLESVTDPHVILSRVATGTGMASAAPSFALLPCHKAVLALCQWVTAARPGDRPTARQLHAAAAEMLVGLREHASAVRGSEGAAGAADSEVIACGEVLTLGRATRAHVPVAAGWTDALVAAAPLTRSGEVVVHPLIGIVELGGARPSPEPFTGPLPPDVARRADAAADASTTEARDGEEFVDAEDAGDATGDSSAEEFGTPASTAEAGSHAVFSDSIEPVSPRPRRMFGTLIDTLLIAGAGFGYGGAANAAAAPCNSCDSVKRVRGSAGLAGPASDPGAKRPAASLATQFTMDSPRIGAGGMAPAAVACSPCTLVGLQTVSVPRLYMSPARCSSPPLPQCFSPPRSPAAGLAGFNPPMHAAQSPLGSGAAPAAPRSPERQCAAEQHPAAPGTQHAGLSPPAFLPTLAAIPSITDSVGMQCDAESGSPLLPPMKAADCVAHDIMETTTSCGSSDDSCFEVRPRPCPAHSILCGLAGRCESGRQLVFVLSSLTSSAV